MTEAIFSPLMPSYRDLSLRIVRSRSVPSDNVLELVHHVHRLTEPRCSLGEWLAPVRWKAENDIDRVLSTSMITAGFVGWMLHHQPLPLLDGHELTTAALFMDVGLIALSLATERPPQWSPLALAEWDRRHPELSAAYFASVEPRSSSVCRMIRHHHERLDGAGATRRIRAADLHPSDRLLAVAVRTIAGLQTQAISFNSPAVEAVAGELVAESLAGDWDRTFVEPTLGGLGCFASSLSTPTLPPATNNFRLDNGVAGVRPPHFPPHVADVRVENHRNGKRIPMELAGPHFRLSELPFIRRPHARERSFVEAATEVPPHE